MTTLPASPMDLSAVQRLRKVAVLAALLLLIGAALVTQSIGGVDGPWHETVEAVGLAAIVFSIVGRAWCTLYIGGRKKADVVDRGPYSLTRNPLYLFSFFGAFGVGAQSGSVTIALGFVLASLLIFRLTVSREETFLAREFGERYVAYRDRTPRFLPNFSLWRDSDELTIRPSLFLLTLRDGMVFLLAIPFFEAIDLAQAAHWLGVVARLP